MSLNGISSITLSDLRGVIRPKRGTERNLNIFPTLEIKNTSAVYKDESVRRGSRRATANKEEVDPRIQKGEKSLLATTDKNFYMDFSKRLHIQKSEIEERNDMIATLQRNFEELKIAYQEEKQDNNDKVKLISQQKENLDRLNQRLKSIQTDYEEKFEKMVNEYKNTKQSQQNAKPESNYSLIRKIDDLEKSLASKSMWIEVNEKGMKEIKDRVEKLEKEKLTYIEKIQKAEGEVQKLQSEKKSNSSTTKNLENRIEELLSDNENLKKELNATQGKIKELSKVQNQRNSSIDDDFKNIQKKLKETGDLVNQLQKEIKEKDKIIDERTKEIKDKEKLVDDRTNEIKQLGLNKESMASQITELAKKVQLLEKQALVAVSEENKQLIREKQSLEKNSEEMKTQILSYKSKLEVLEKSIATIKENQTESKLGRNMESKTTLKRKISVLEETQNKLMKNLNCGYCSQAMIDPVTCIPCGHSYCKICKVGYQKQCYKCPKGEKIEAVYRNELLDDIVAMVEMIENSKNLLKTRDNF